jgi:hypothetical protein
MLVAVVVVHIIMAVVLEVLEEMVAEGLVLEQVVLPMAQ